MRFSGGPGATAIPLIWLLLWLGAGMTAFYMFRLLFLTFWGEETHG